MAATDSLDPVARAFREINARLKVWVDSLFSDSAETGAVSPQLMAGLLAELRQAGEQLQCAPRGRQPELEKDLGDYRLLVERLRDRLPLVHDALLRERARLERERARVAAAAEWARRSRQTL